MSKVPFKFTQFQTNTTFKGVITTQFNSDDPKKKHKFKKLFNQFQDTNTTYFNNQKFSLTSEEKSSYVGKKQKKKKKKKLKFFFKVQEFTNL